MKLHQYRIVNVIEVDFHRRVSELVDGKPRILIVDNNRDFTRSARLILERTGKYSVCEENEATRAQQTASRIKPALILLDIVMPDIDGGEVAARIQSDPALQRTPIVFLTALVTKDETRPGLRIQGRPFLAKPVTLPELLGAIEENLPIHAVSSFGHRIDGAPSG